MGQTAVLIVAAGRGSRAGEADGPKQYRPIAGGSVLQRTLEAVLQVREIDSVLVVIHPQDHDRYEAAIGGLAEREGRILAPVAGGATRQASVHAGLEALAVHSPAPAKVLIHDAARPFVSPRCIADVLAALETSDGAISAIPVTDTLKRDAGDGSIAGTVSRDGLWRALTPQGFGFAAILAAHRAAAAAGRNDFTDDAAILEWRGGRIVLVAGSPANVKLTTAQDIAEADARLRCVAGASSQLDQPDEIADPAVPDVRVGHGYDVHALGPGTGVVLCGITIPHDGGLIGHSDADVALHALTDALLGALGDGDIGTHFPPSDPKWRGQSSDLFLADAVARVRARRGVPTHLDITLVCEAPRIGPHRLAMIERVSAITGVSPGRISVKATTSERLGFTGRREGIAALATATVVFGSVSRR
ncbi:MAG: bifunctional 2-C-methyl-D-erythritol 4-phosphate cytidylyltransferase/2-C-methyl-D-erythritol 2,4-cyclodiphosphate synthase [Rhizobiales bacterium]|nr:bifunctional 2-C-methyl-D-erythritol 4-phosphate cytidylyltransferase/2-C-methyl-D-erythritol 2,4-cyclodiphosphate synthase [Hyphomicrobiales bacterium]